MLIEMRKFKIWRLRICSSFLVSIPNVCVCYVSSLKHQFICIMIFRSVVHIYFQFQEVSRCTTLIAYIFMFIKKVTTVTIFFSLVHSLFIILNWFANIFLLQNDCFRSAVFFVADREKGKNKQIIYAEHCLSQMFMAEHSIYFKWMREFLKMKKKKWVNFISNEIIIIMESMIRIKHSRDWYALVIHLFQLCFYIVIQVNWMRIDEHKIRAIFNVLNRPQFCLTQNDHDEDWENDVKTEKFNSFRLNNIQIVAASLFISRFLLYTLCVHFDIALCFRAYVCIYFTDWTSIDVVASFSSKPSFVGTRFNSTHFAIGQAHIVCARVCV